MKSNQAKFLIEKLLDMWDEFDGDLHTPQISSFSRVIKGRGESRHNRMSENPKSSQTGVVCLKPFAIH